MAMGSNVLGTECVNDFVCNIPAQTYSVRNNIYKKKALVIRTKEDSTNTSLLQTIIWAQRHTPVASKEL